MPKKTRKPADRLTTHQLKVFRDVEEIASMIKLNYPYILAYKRDARTPVIEHMLFSKEGLNAFLDDMDKMASYFWSIEPDRLILDFGDAPEQRESSALTLGSAE